MTKLTGESAISQALGARQKASVVIGVPGSIGWHPVFIDDGYRRTVQSYIISLLQRLRQHQQANAEWHAHVALLGHYLLRLPEHDWFLTDSRGDLLRFVVEQLAHAVDELSRLPTMALHGGVAGVGWVIAHLSTTINAADVELSLEELDTFLSQAVCEESWDGHFDLISGLLGLAAYFFERPSFEGSRNSLTAILNHLDRMAEPRENGLFWPTPIGCYPRGVGESQHLRRTDLGVAHGLPGVVGILCQLVAMGIDPPRSHRLFRGALDGLLTSRSADDPLLGFPYQAEDRCLSRPARLAWCYGDLGIAGVLAAGADRLADQRLAEEAQRLASTAAMRESLASGILDAGLCHGAAGVAHLFNRLYQRSGDVRLQEAAVRYYLYALEFLSAGHGNHRFDPTAAAGEPWVEDDSFLGGAIGIALALLTACFPISPDWDRLLLVS